MGIFMSAERNLQQETADYLWEGCPNFQSDVTDWDEPSDGIEISRPPTPETGLPHLESGRLESTWSAGRQPKCPDSL